MPRDWLIKKRNKLDISQQNVAGACSITRAYYTQIESGVRNPSVVVAKRIAKYLNFDWTIFLAINVTKRNITKVDIPQAKPQRHRIYFEINI